MSPNIFLITNLSVNHNPAAAQPHRRLPIDPRFLNAPDKYQFYLTDSTPPSKQLPGKVVVEATLDPLIHKAGASHLAEWSFLLAEEKYSFCSYPFFMISSRFYMKNGWLTTDLNQEWDRLFSYFSLYSHGFLPSYCRPMRWVKFRSLMNNPRVFFPFTPKCFELIETLYNLKIPEDYPIFPDLGCHYLGFRSRNDLLEYLDFYKPILNFFFLPDFTEKNKIRDFVKESGHYPNEKPLTFLLEALSHLYFFKNKKKFFCLHYDGYYEIDFARSKFTKLHRFPIPLWRKLERQLRFRKWWIATEGPGSSLYSVLLKVWKKLRLWKEKLSI